jgi:hypothetical protein
MPYFRITVIKQNGLKHSGVRHFPESLTYKQVEAQVWQKARDTIGRLAISDIRIENVPADHPEVVAYILQERDASSRPKK